LPAWIRDIGWIDAVTGNGNEFEAGPKAIFFVESEHVSE
jgi:hypothetical protein